MGVLLMKKFLTLALILSSTSSFATEYSTKIVVDDSFENKPIVSSDDRYNFLTDSVTTHKADITTAASNSMGVSYNNFSEFGMLSDFRDQLFGCVESNIYTDDNTKMIVFNVTGDKGSYVVADYVNIHNPKADFIFANKNGYLFTSEIKTNGKVGFITDNVETTDGKVDMIRYKDQFNAGSVYAYITDPKTQTRTVIGGDFIDEEMNSQLINNFLEKKMVVIDSQGNIILN
jgi:hypothetical protein